MLIRLYIVYWPGREALLVLRAIALLRAFKIIKQSIEKMY